jgi:hypothetical protein
VREVPDPLRDSRLEAARHLSEVSRTIRDMDSPEHDRRKITEHGEIEAEGET